MVMAEGNGKFKCESLAPRAPTGRRTRCKAEPEQCERFVSIEQIQLDATVAAGTC